MRLIRDIEDAFKKTNIEPSIYRNGASLKVTFKLKEAKFNILRNYAKPKFHFQN